MRRRLLDLTAALTLGGSLSCAELGPSELEACGNGIVEPGNFEDCDGAATCIPAGQASACAWSCTEAECPAGFGCGDDKVCLAHGYVLERGPTIGQERVAWTEAADFDGDGRDDLASVASRVLDPAGDLSVAFLDGDATAERIFHWPRTGSRPTLGDAVGDDGLVDVVLTGDLGVLLEDPFVDLGLPPLSGVSVLRNDGSRDFVPAVIADAWKPAAEPNAIALAGFGLYAIDGSRLHELLGSGYWSESPFDGLELPALATDPAHAIALAVEPDQDDGLGFAAVTGAAIGGGLYEGEVTRFDQLDYDERTWAVRTLTLPAGAGDATGWVAYRDVDGDGHLDLLAQTLRGAGDEGEPPNIRRWAIWVAWGRDADIVCVMGAPEPGCGFELLVDPWDGIDEMNPDAFVRPGRALLAQDLNADGVIDFVFESGVALSGPESFCPEEPQCEDDDCEGLCCTPEAGALSYACDVDFELGQEQAPGLSTAVAADITGDGRLDILGIAPGGPSSAVVVAEALPDGGYLEGPPRFVGATVAELAVGLLDRDSNPDVVVRREGEGRGDDEILVFWGDQDGEAQSLVRDVELAPGIGIGWFGIVPRQPGPLHLVVERTGELGVAALLEAGDKRFTSSLPTIASALETPNGWLENATIGRFSGPGPLELAAFGITRESEQLSEQVATVRLTEDGESGAYGFDLATPWIAKATPGFYDTLPDHAAMGSSQLAGDLDGDGRDELVIVGASAYEIRDRVRGVGDGLVSVHRHVGAQWTFVKDIVIAGLPVGGRWPFVERARQAELADLDGDGDLDLFMIAEASDGTRPYVVIPGAHDSLARKPIVPPSSRSWDAASLLSLDRDGLMRVAAVADGELIVGALDPETFELDERTTQTAPAGVTWSTAGDFDHDGLVDLGLATDTGVAIYRGIAAVPQ